MATDLTNWQSQSAKSIKDIATLLNYLDIDATQANIPTSTLDFPLRVPMSYINRMEKNNINDPLLKQILPINAEYYPQPGFSKDPVGDLKSIKSSGIIQKYQGRYLLITTSVCAIHCRYCFRRHFPYADHRFNVKQLDNDFKTIQQNQSIREIILSGGDPLSLSEKKLHYISDHLNQINHIKTLRIHTRLPVVIPERINRQFINWLKTINQKIVIVFHFNHPNEINNDVKERVQRLAPISPLLLNQSVLLKGINDNANTLIRLSEKLVEMNVLPYYLHLLDKVQGAAHFDVDGRTATQIHQQLMTHLPGYLVPKLVHEQPGYPYKKPLFLHSHDQ